MMANTNLLHDALSFIPANDMDTRLKVGTIIKTLFGENGYSSWYDWSNSTDTQQSSQELRLTWESVHADGNVTSETLFQLAKRYGWSGEKAKHPQPPEESTDCQPTSSQEETDDLPDVVQTNQQEIEDSVNTESPQTLDAVNIARLASLTELDYERIREAESKRYGVRVSVLDKQVKAARHQEDNSTGIEDIAPWPSEIDPPDLLSEISITVQRFIVCQDETAHTVALWAAMTWLMDVVQVAPLAVITAPEKRCGKSQLLSVLGRLVRRPLTASNITPAALFRSIDAWQPTLLVDEADAFMKENEELRGLLNCGHTRESAYTVRVVGEDYTPRKFNVWGAKAIAGIGHLADTLMDRAITLELRRKLPQEHVERLRHAEPLLFRDLASKLARFAEDYREAVRRARPDLPDSLNDREQDNWEPLLAIAEVAGGPWPQLGRTAALKLSVADSQTMTVGTELLSDIKLIFETKRIERISTAELIEALCEDDEAPWGTYNRVKPISPRQIAKRLKEYGISSETIRLGNKTAKGYKLEWFVEAFSRYLPSPTHEKVTTSQPTDNGGSGVTDKNTVTVTPTESVTRETAQIKECDGVTDTNGKGQSDYVEEEV